MKLKSLRKNKKGFTLTELIVVLAIIAIMVAVSVPNFISYVDKTNDQMEALNERNEELKTQLDGVLDNLPTPTSPIQQ